MTDSGIPPQEEWVPRQDSEWQQWLSLRRIWQAITSAMQPIRLVIGLLMIVALGTFGSGWDRTFQPGIAPQGLLHGAATDAQRAREQSVFQELARSHVAPELWPTVEPQDGELTATGAVQWEHIEARWLVREMRTGYRNHRSELESADLPAADERFVADLNRVNTMRLKGSWESLATAAIDGFNSIVYGCVTLDFGLAWTGLGVLCIATPVALWQTSPWFTAVFALVLIVVLALGGGALSRLAVMQFATNERMSLRESFTMSLLLWRPLIGSQLLPLVFIAVFVGLLLLIGLVMRVPLLNIVGGMGLGIWLLFGFTIAFLLICYVAGYCMLIPAVVAEGGDSADAMQRAFSYVAARPLHLLAAYVLALLGLVVGYIIVATVASLTVNATLGSMEFAAGSALVDTEGRFGVFDVVAADPRAVMVGWTDASAAWFIDLWLYIVSALVGGYVLAYLFSASSIIYLLMRSIADGQSVDDVWSPVPVAVPGPTASDDTVHSDSGSASAATGDAASSS